MKQKLMIIAQCTKMKGNAKKKIDRWRPLTVIRLNGFKSAVFLQRQKWIVNYYIKKSCQRVSVIKTNNALLSSWQNMNKNANSLETHRSFDKLFDVIFDDPFLKLWKYWAKFTYCLQEVAWMMLHSDLCSEFFVR